MRTATWSSCKPENEEGTGRINMGSSVYSTPVPANGVLYISNRNQLYALAEAKPAAAATK